MPGAEGGEWGLSVPPGLSGFAKTEVAAEHHHTQARAAAASTAAETWREPERARTDGRRNPTCAEGIMGQPRGSNAVCRADPELGQLQ